MAAASKFDKLSRISSKIRRAKGASICITDAELIQYLLGHDRSHAALGARAPILIDPALYGLKDYQIEIAPARDTPWGERKSPEINLSRLALPGGGALPSLVFRHCRFLAPINIGGSTFASFRIDECEGHGVIGIKCIVHGNLTIGKFRLPEASECGSSNPSSTCRVRLSGARIGGSADFCGSVLSSPKEQDLKERKNFAEQFALALDGANIGGRVLLADDFKAVGGVTLFQAHVARDILIDDARVYTHQVGEAGGEDNSRVNYAAIDAKQLRCKGGLHWRGDKSVIHGRFLLTSARIGNDLILENLRWSARPEAGRGITNGGLDCRRISVGGQVHIHGKSRIARRVRRPRGLEDSHVIGVALDLWKAHVRRGIYIEKDVVFCGAIQLNQARIEHYVAIEASIQIESAPPPENIPYHTALDCRDAFLKGSMTLNLQQAGGRVTLEGMHVTNHITLERVGFDLTRQKAPVYNRESQATEVPDMRRAPRLLPFFSYIPRRLVRRLESLKCRRTRLKCRRTRVSPARFDGTSVLNLQDATIGGRMNLRRDSIGMRCRAYIPVNRFIVDLRGLSAESWDDAEATCWNGLATRRTPKKAHLRRRKEYTVAYTV